MIPWLILLISAPAYALTEGEYQGSLERLKSRQAETDSWMRRMGVNASSPLAGVKGSGAEDQSKTSLFRVHGELSTARLPVGKLLYARLLNRLVVGPDGSPVLLVLEQDQGAVSGARLLGMARQSGTEGRLALEIGKILLPTGRAVSFQGTGLDTAGAFGIEARIFSGKALALAGSMASSFVSGLASSQQTQTFNALGFSTPQVTGRNALLQGLAQTAADQSKRLIDQATAEKPVLVVESETPISILVQEEVRF